MRRAVDKDDVVAFGGHVADFPVDVLMRVRHDFEAHSGLPGAHCPLLSAGLGVGIDEEDFKAAFTREDSGEVHGEGGFSAAPFLISYRDHGRHSTSLYGRYITVNK